MRLSSYLTFGEKVFCKRGLPLQLGLFVTAKCNLRCRHCFYWQNLNASSQELSLEEIEKISKGLPNLLLLSLTGGEPFLREDLPEIAKVFYRNSNVRHIIIPTNGIQAEKIIPMVEEIVSACKESHLSVYVSLDGTDKTHNAIRGREESFRLSVRTLKELKSLQSNFKNLDVCTVTTVLSINQTEQMALYNFIKKEIRPNNIAVNLVRGNVKDGNIKNVDINFYEEICRSKKKDALYGKKPCRRYSLGGLVMAKDFVMHDIIIETFKEKKYLYPCYAGKIGVVINEEGIVYPCEMLNNEMGKLKDYDYDFKALWTSEKAKAVRNYIEKKKCFCTWECAISTNILFNPRLYPRVVKEYAYNLFFRRRNSGRVYG